MGQVLGKSNTHIRAVEGSDIPTLKVSGTVGDDFQGSDLADALIAHAKDHGEARLILETFGGSASAAFSFYDTIRSEGIRIYVDGRGTVASAGTIIMAAAGRKRSRLYPNAKYLVHNATGDDPGAVANANIQMQDIYMELTGMTRSEIKALMSEDRLLNAQEAKRMGFVGAIVDHMKLAAHADNTDTMDKENKTKRVFAVDRDKALAAMVTGHIEIDLDAADSDMKVQLDSAMTDLKAEREKVADLEASAKTQPEAVKAAVDTAEKALKATHESDLKTVGIEVDKLKAEIVELKKTPAASAVKPAGGTTAEVDSTIPLAERYTKLSPEKLEASFSETLVKKRAERAKAKA